MGDEQRLLLCSTNNHRISFNPFDFDDETYDDRNTFKVAMLPELFIKSLGRELYHSNERFKKFINEQFTKLSDDVKLVQGLKH